MRYEKIPENDWSIEKRQETVLKYTDLVWKAAHRICPKPDLLEDCVQEGFKGLCRAANLYDESRGYKFITFAGFEIDCAIRDFLYKNTMIRIPDSERQKITQYRKKVAKLHTEEIEVTPSVLWDIAKQFEINEICADLIIRPVMSTDTPISIRNNDTTLTIGDTIPASSMSEVEDNMVFKQLSDCIMSFMRSWKAEKDEHRGNPLHTEIICTYVESMITGAINGLDKPAITLLDLIRHNYPEFTPNEEDNEEERKYKAKKLDNVYCNVSAKWVPLKTTLRSIVDNVLEGQYA